VTVQVENRIRERHCIGEQAAQGARGSLHLNRRARDANIASDSKFWFAKFGGRRTVLAKHGGA
jgi:hypothetical protein